MFLWWTGILSVPGSFIAAYAGAKRIALKSLFAIKHSLVSVFHGKLQFFVCYFVINTQLDVALATHGSHLHFPLYTNNSEQHFEKFNVRQVAAWLLAARREIIQCQRSDGKNYCVRCWITTSDIKLLYVRSAQWECECDMAWIPFRLYWQSIPIGFSGFI